MHRFSALKKKLPWWSAGLALDKNYLGVEPESVFGIYDAENVENSKRLKYYDY